MESQRKVLAGRVTSTKMQKTVVVQVEIKRAHPLYRKIVRKVKNFLAHDEEEQCKEGDMVRIRESRPLSRRKRWTVIEIVK
ncbi:MAG: 30S ribosomal protein S17 [Chloroflexi bacterium]|nr:30S ribosomal protein S17 [Chloroflexota bacterium]